MRLLDGKKVKQEVLEELKEELKKIGKLTLAVVQVGNIDASNTYVNNKRKMAESIGMNFKHLHLPEDVTEDELLEIIDRLNKDEEVTGLMIQMPLPSHIDAKKVQNRVDSSKDVDGLCDVNMGRLAHNNSSALVPCTAQGIVDILDYYNIDIEGQNVVIVGRSDLVGKPLASLMLNRNATVTVCHSKTKNLSSYTKNADILVAAVGKAKMFKESDIKDGAVVIDVGINRDEKGKLCGDVDFENVKDKVSYITPVPGGVGQMTVANLGKNTVKAYKLKLNN